MFGCHSFDTATFWERRCLPKHHSIERKVVCLGGNLLSTWWWMQTVDLSLLVQNVQNGSWRRPEEKAYTKDLMNSEELWSKLNICWMFIVLFRYLSMGVSNSSIKIIKTGVLKIIITYFLSSMLMRNPSFSNSDKDDIGFPTRLDSRLQ